jgi:hypothetical protein
MSRAVWMQGDVFEQMAKLPDGSVDLIVTSPPFLALRSYLPADHPDKGKEIGSEPTPAAFLSTLLALTRGWRRVLAPHGSICVELGDTYSGSGGGGGDYMDGGWREGQQQFAGSASSMRESNAAHWRQKNQDKAGWPLAKSLCGIPTLYAWSLAYGRNLLDPADLIDPWRIRNVIVWHRPNPPVGALGDKVRPSTSYITVATVAANRWFDLDAERTEHTKPNGNGMMRAKTQTTGSRADDGLPFYNEGHPAGAPPLDCWFDEADGDDVWTIPTQPYAGAHYATWPIRLASRLINLMCPRQVCRECGEPRRRLVGDAEYVSTTGGRVVNQWAGERRGENVNGWKVEGGNPGHAVRSAPTLGWSDCGCVDRSAECTCPTGFLAKTLTGHRPECPTRDNWRNGVVLDPFAGSGTTLAAASGLGRDSIGIDLDGRNLDLARERIGMFLEEADDMAGAPLFDPPRCPMCGYDGCWWSAPDEDGNREYDCDRCKAHGRYGKARRELRP